MNKDSLYHCTSVAYWRTVSDITEHKKRKECRKLKNDSKTRLAEIALRLNKSTMPHSTALHSSLPLHILRVSSL